MAALLIKATHVISHVRSHNSSPSERCYRKQTSRANERPCFTCRLTIFTTRHGIPLTIHGPTIRVKATGMRCQIRIHR